MAKRMKRDLWWWLKPHVLAFGGIGVSYLTYRLFPDNAALLIMALMVAIMSGLVGFAGIGLQYRTVRSKH